MKPLLTTQQYQNRILFDIRDCFPWIGDAVIKPAPGNIDITREYLSEIQEIVGSAIQENLEFLRISHDEDGDLQIFINVGGISEARTAALQQARTKATALGRRMCLGCGSPVSRGTRLCEDHSDISNFLMDGTEERKSPGQRDLSSIFDMLGEDCPQDEADVGSEVTDDSKVASPPVIRVFDLADVALLEKSAEGKESDTRERIRGVAKKLHGASGSGVKPLAMLRPDWRLMLDKFEADFPNFGEFVEFLRDQFALSELGDKRIAIPPVLFDGPPGIGKTEVALSLAALIDTDSMELDMAVAQSCSALSGSDAFWSNTREGRLFEVLAYGRTANPVVFLDELDKVTGDERYRPDAALYQLLEPRTAESFRDLSIREVKLDASQVLWFAATNDLERVNAPIRSRFVVFNIPLPTHKQSAAIAHSIYRRLIERNAWGTAMAPDITDTVANCLAASPPRVMRTLLAQACGRAARQGRRELMVGDICLSLPARKMGIGFVREDA